MPKIRQSIEQTEKDSNGNVISSSKHQVLSWGEEPNYIKLYLQDVMYLHDIPKQYGGLIYSLLTRVSYAGEKDGMCVTLVSHTKKTICEELGWKTVATLDNALQKLLMGKILYRVARSVYRFNPYLFGKGNWQDIARMRLEINYSEIKGRTFQTNIEYESNKLKRKQFKIAK